MRSVAADGIRIQALNPGNCPRCAEGRGCGGGILSRLVAQKRPDVRAETRVQNLQVGDGVIVGIDESVLLQASVWVYIVPLLAMLVAGGVAHQLLKAPDLIVMIFGLAGLGLGLAWVGQRSREAASDPSFRPVILRRDPGLGQACARRDLA